MKSNQKKNENNKSKTISSWINQTMKGFLSLTLLLFFLLFNYGILTFSPEKSAFLYSTNKPLAAHTFDYWATLLSTTLWLFFGSLNYFIIALGWTILFLISINRNRSGKKLFIGSLLLFISISILYAHVINDKSDSLFQIFFTNGILLKKTTLLLAEYFSQNMQIALFFILLFAGYSLLFNIAFVTILRISYQSLKYTLKHLFFFAFLYFKKILLFIPWIIKKAYLKKNIKPPTINEAQKPREQKKEPSKKFFSLSCSDQKLPLPSLAFFKLHNTAHNQEDGGLFNQNQKKILEETLAFFGIYGHVDSIHSGPVITLFEYVPDLGSKISKIIALENDLALKLKAQSLRIIAPIPGKHCIGFEIAHDHRETVYFANLILKKNVLISDQQIPLLIGVDIMGNPAIIDLPTMPHLLIAGSTGSGKSVGMHSIVASIIALQSHLEVKIIMIDPKRLEFSNYHDIPHLLFPLINEANKAAAALRWLVKEMKHRYIVLAEKNMRNINDFHQQDKAGSQEMPFIILLIDELADLMMIAGKEIELELARLAQMARAAGIFLIVATQRPSVDVITGLIKVNFPSRIAYRVTSKIDSRTILDQMGADKLLGKGDLLFLHASMTNLQRLHGAYLSNQEIITLANEVRKLGTPEYQTIALENEIKISNAKTDFLQDDSLYQEIEKSLKNMEEISISMIQRRYRIGFNRSARIIEKLESEGLIGPAQGSKSRKVL